jgi:hypothetical protein
MIRLLLRLASSVGSQQHHDLSYCLLLSIYVLYSTVACGIEALFQYHTYVHIMQGLQPIEDGFYELWGKNTKEYKFENYYSTT